ncbi:hypothetical protein [Roseisolibacter agri]|uniref:Uncharacterized protein n=1 Tax=Roseisolibacter agri TaxID=2014610 RepID=A0AA37Q1E9_9BACT|nr:hypothetical protein [Roseisolibacter agri]GLC24830.1 hypothetical protein rosag_13430 [Roseisolibacter agri]
MRTPLYAIFGLLVLAGAAWADLRGWTPIRAGEARVGPRSVRENPGAYRTVYRSSTRYRLGK